MDTASRPLHILLVDDEKIIHQTLGDYLTDSGHRVSSARNAEKALQLVQQHDYDLAVVDIKMPGMDGLVLLERILADRPVLPVVMITGHGSMETVIQAMRRGAADFLVKTVKLLELDAVVEKSLHFRKLHQDKMRLRETVAAIQAGCEQRAGDFSFVCASPAMKQIKNQIDEVVETGCETVMIIGETGTGKEVVSRQIHIQGETIESPFIAVSCPTLPETLLESELFGHCRGAFTGADRDRTGHFELAANGTLLLDEVADLSPNAQASLLRVLETRSFRRVGGTKEIQVAVRVIATTNVAIEELVQSRRFRQDLYYRLAVYSIHVPPLRKRAEDILPLAEAFLARFAGPRHMPLDGFSTAARKHLAGYSYPGNARELRNIVENAAIRCRSGTISPHHLSLPRNAATRPPPEQPETRHGGEADRIRTALEASKWNRRQAARQLGLPYSTLRYKIRVLGLDR